MPSFSLLLAAAAAISLFCLWWITRSSAPGAHFYTPIQPKPIAQLQDSSEEVRLPAGILRPISFTEFLSRSECSHECILVEIGSEPQLELISVPGVFVFPVSPSELPEVLRWLPSDKVVAFYGVSESSCALIEASSCMESPAPRFVLRNLPDRLEVR
jgi:hypothetical protein